MPLKHYWAPADDEALRTRCANRQSWDEIAAVLGVSRSTARERGRAIGARRPAPATPLPDAVTLGDPNRDPLPAGHPIAWAVLTEDTALAGAASPWPPLPPAPECDPQLDP